VVRRGLFFKLKVTNMFRLKVLKLINDYGIKREYIIELISSNRNSFQKKMKGEVEFSEHEKELIKNKYGSIM